MLEEAADAILVVDERGCILLLNRQVEVLFGYDREELRGASVSRLLPPEARPSHAGHVAGYAAGPAARPMGTDMDLWAMRKDGSRFPADISLAPVRSGDRLFVTATIRDVTARHEFEAERERLAAAVAETEVRERMAVELHDGTLQAMYGIGLTLSTALNDYGTEAARLRIQRATEEMQQAIETLRTFILAAGVSDDGLPEDEAARS
jgi:PAS domain S-box-containing protein